ncbi:MAG TPA: tail protein X [Chthoniobacteraceae bacterium]|nr:tail protein X [Chthoniobacteraceae bacterium]
MKQAQQYQTKEGEAVDAICYRYYGQTSNGEVEATYEANRELDLASYGPTLPAGLVITLPVVEPARKDVIRLFS